MVGLIMAETMCKAGGVIRLKEWWASTEADYYFENYPEVYDGIYSYMMHRGLVS
jgi:hypothetical protein